MNLNFLGGFSENIPISNFMKIRPVGAELFHADMKITVAFSNVANAPKNGIRAPSCAMYPESLIRNSLL